MNKIWLFIIIISIIFGLISGNVEKMVNSLFDVPNDVIKTLFKIGSMLVIYNGIFKIAIKTNVIDKLSIVLKKPINKIFKVDEDCKKLISTSIICNLLGLGPANMTIAIKVVERIKSTRNMFYNLTMYLLINISSLCLLPLSLLTLRNSLGARHNISFIFIIFISSLVTTLIAIIFVRIFCKKEDNDE